MPREKKVWDLTQNNKSNIPLETKLHYCHYTLVVVPNHGGEDGMTMSW